MSSPAAFKTQGNEAPGIYHYPPTTSRKLPPEAGIALPHALSEWAAWVAPVGRLPFLAGRVVTALR